MPQIEWSGAYHFCPVCPVFGHLCQNFLAHEMENSYLEYRLPYQITLRSITIWPWQWVYAEISILDFAAFGGMVFHKHISFILYVLLIMKQGYFYVIWLFIFTFPLSKYTNQKKNEIPRN